MTTDPDSAADPTGDDGQPGSPRPPWLPPSIVGTDPLRAPNGSVQARQQARSAAGLDAEGLGYPRSQLWVIAVLPAAVIGLLCLLALLITGSVLWGVAAVGAAAVAGASAGHLLRDPLRMSSAERRALVADRAWHSSRPWTGALAGTPERALVSRAQDAVVRLVRAPAWGTPAFEEHRLRLDLKAELDEIDEQAHELALGGAGPHRQTGAAPEAARTALTRRVEALAAYADAVVALGPGNAAPGRENEQQTENALVATVRDEFATERLALLKAELPSTASGLDGMPALTTYDRTTQPAQPRRPYPERS